MAQIHCIEQGEHLVQIAERYGFLDHRIIWDHPRNAELKALRKTPHVLYPGDRVYIPDKQPRKEHVSTTRVHRFRLAGETLKVRIALRDFDHHPLTDMHCELELEGTTYTGQTNAQGIVFFEVPKSPQAGVLRAPEASVEQEVRVGHLDPHTEASGWQGRLLNLGYYAGPPGELDAELLGYALEEFQCDFGLKLSGEADAATRDKLREVHGS